MNFYEVIPPPEVAINFSPYQVHAHHFLSCPPLSVLQQATQIFPSRYLPRFASMADAPREQFIATRTTKLPLPHSSGHQRAGLELDEFTQMIRSDVYPTRRLQIASGHRSPPDEKFFPIRKTRCGCRVSRSPWYGTGMLWHYHPWFPALFQFPIFSKAMYAKDKCTPVASIRALPPPTD